MIVGDRAETAALVSEKDERVANAAGGARGEPFPWGAALGREGHGYRGRESGFPWCIDCVTGELSLEPLASMRYRARVCRCTPKLLLLKMVLKKIWPRVPAPQAAASFCLSPPHTSGPANRVPLYA